MIASILHLDRHAVKALRITDPYSVHRVVYSLFADIRNDEDKDAGQSSGILYADQGGDFSGRKILLLANRPPTELDGDGPGQVQSKEIPESFLSFDNYRFKIIINPTKRDSVSRKLLPIKGREAIAKWFSDRAVASWGFEVVPQYLQVEKVEVLQFKGKNNRFLTIAQAQILGQLRVTDRARFQNSFTKGIGHARSFGCGLLQIVPLIGPTDSKGASK